MWPRLLTVVLATALVHKTDHRYIQMMAHILQIDLYKWKMVKSTDLDDILK